MIKKALTGLIFFGLLFPLTSMALAQTATSTPTTKPNQIRKELKNELKEKKEELKDGLKEKLQENKVERKNIIEEVKAKIADSIIKNGVVQGEVATLSGTILPATILVTTNKSEKNPKSITLNITADAILLRKFGASSSMSEIHVGDKIIARGTWTDNTKTVLKVSSLRNNSVQKRNATFWGKISSIATESSSIVVSTQKGDQTIEPDSSTKYTNRSGGPISFTDLKIGHWIRVSGVWDTVLKLVTEVKNIKDWTLPPAKK